MFPRALVVVLIGCSGGGAAIDASTEDATPPPDASICEAPARCDWLDGYQRRIVASLSGAEDIAPGLRIDGRTSVAERDATRAFLRDELAALGYTPVDHAYTMGRNTGANVLATLDATTGTGGLIVVGAHFDSVPAAPGAADNATGVAIVLATARYLRDVPVRHHPVVFAFFDEEELGLYGSINYARSLVDANTDVTGVHIFDMLSFDGDGDRAVELWSPSPALADLYTMHGTAAGMPVSVVTFRFSDHQAFLDVGLPAVGIGEEFTAGDRTPHYHKATDKFEHVSFDHLAAVTRLGMSAIGASVAAP